jgi:hypothetical protein
VKRLLTLVGAIATLAAGVTAAVALGAGSSSPDTATDTTTVTTATDTTTVITAPDTATADTTTVTTAPDTATGTTAILAAGATTNSASSKVWVCHHTGSWKHPYRLIHISTHALPAHMNLGDVTPVADNSCPTTQPASAKTHGRGNEQSNKTKTKHDNPGKGDDKTETDDD